MYLLLLAETPHLLILQLGNVSCDSPRSRPLLLRYMYAYESEARFLPNACQCTYM